MNNNEHTEKRILEETINNISKRRKAPRHVFVILLALYLISNMIVSISAGSGVTIMFRGTVIPVYSFAGVFSAVANICIIFLAVYYGKVGYYTALVVVLMQLPMILMGIIINHNYTSIPGVFGNILTIIAITVIYINNTRLDKYQAEIQRQATTDMLTGLPNRFASHEVINDYIRKGRRFASVNININGFKGINDTMGFDVGNRVLVEIASRWKKIAEEGQAKTLDFIARISGDEFALLIRAYRSEEDIINTIRTYEKALEEKMTIGGYDFYITASFGYAEFPTDADDVDTLVSYTDMAMHEVKSVNSGNHILRFTHELLRNDHTIVVVNKIRKALENDLIFFNLQPQYDMNHKLRGFEALARMKDEEGNVISPGDFIPVAEKVGLIDKIDSTVFKKAGEFFGKLINDTGSDITLSINASVRHFMKNDFIDEIRKLLKSCNIPPNQLEIEITESLMLDATDKVFQCIEEIKKMGVKLAIDDFGTGYSSLSYLNSFPADLLKIDKSFIDKMNTSDSSKQYVAAIISLGHIMGFDVISEGVEEQDQIDTLREIGCDFIQGFVWGRPLPKEEAEKLVV